MSPQVRRGFALPLVLLALLAGPAAAQLPEAPTPPTGGGPQPEPVPKPDLVPGNARANASDERFPSEVCVEVANVGGNQATTYGPFDVTLRVGGSPSEPQRVTRMLRSGEVEEKCWTLDLPAGDHAVSWTVDSGSEVDEEREDNNDGPTRWLRVRPTPQPDLAVLGLQVLPRVAQDGRPQYFHAVVRNVGDGPSPETRLDLADDGAPIARLRVRALQPGEEASLVAWTRPELRPAGAFVARAVVDPDQEVEERLEDNNEATAAFEVPDHPLPDLVVQDAVVTGRLEARQTLRLNVTIANAGDAKAGAFSVLVLDGETTLVNLSRESLGVDANATFSRLLSLPEGDHSLRIVVDAGRVLAERDETNNEHVLALAIAPQPVRAATPNLVVESLDAAPNDPGPGEAVRVLALVRNTGEQRSAETVVAFTVDGRPLARVVLAPLEPGRAATLPVTWRADLGSHTLRAVADPDGEVAEADEGDNEAGLPFVVVAPAPPPPPEGEPPAPATPTPVPSTPVVPTAPTPPTRAPGNGTAELVAVRSVEVATRPVPGGVKGVVVATLHNPSLDPVSRITVTFRVDGAPLREILVEGISGAATTSVSTGELDLPEGDHVVTVEARVVGSRAPTASAQKQYVASAGESGVPGPGLAFVALAAVAAALLARRR